MFEIVLRTLELEQALDDFVWRFRLSPLLLRNVPLERNARIVGSVADIFLEPRRLLFDRLVEVWFTISDHVAILLPDPCLSVKCCHHSLDCRIASSCVDRTLDGRGNIGAD